MSDLTPGRPDLAVASVLAGGLAPRNRAAVDLSRPYATNRVLVDWEDCDRVPAIGDRITAVDATTRQEADADVVGLDEERHTAALAIDWTTIREVTA